MRRAELAETDIDRLRGRCADMGVSFRVSTDSDGECSLIVDGKAFDDLDAARQHVEQLERVLG